MLHAVSKMGFPGERHRLRGWIWDGCVYTFFWLSFKCLLPGYCRVSGGVETDVTEEQPRERRWAGAECSLGPRKEMPYTLYS